MTWRERLVAARERGRFTGEDRIESGSWLSCAVGEQRRCLGDTVIVYKPRSFLYPEVLVPTDATLHRDGVKFYTAIGDGDVDAAERALDAIEDRALQLKREPRLGAAAGEERKGGQR